MKKIQNICKALFFPHIAIMLLLLPIATAFLIYCMVHLESESVIAVLSYVLSAYTLTVWCLRIPNGIQRFKRFQNENQYAKRWTTDVHLRMQMTLCVSLLWNAAYAAFQLWLGISNASFWFCSLAGYYIFLALMRIFLASHTRKYAAGERMLEELKKYRTCGWILLVMNMVLAVMIFFMIYWNRSFAHGQIAAIAMAAYTFTAFTAAIVNIVKYRKYNSPVYSASKAISLAAACVSMITLTSTMMTVFGEGETAFFRTLMLALLGGAVSVFIVGMAVYMIVQGTEKMKRLKSKDSLS